MSQSSWRSVCVWRSGTCQSSIEHQRVMSLISYCYAFVYQSLILLLLLYVVPILSLAAEVMCISVSPGFWMVFSNDPCTGTTNDCDCCLHQLSGHVGKCSITRPWFSQGLVGWGSLPSCICRWVLHLHHHPQLYIACYLVVKVSALLIWQVGTKRSSNKISLILLV